MRVSGQDALLLLCALLRGGLSFDNQPTERLPSSPSSHGSHSGVSVGSPGLEEVHTALLNRAGSGGRGGTRGHDRSDKGQIGCRELRSTKYISDGQCTSVKPIRELVCAGQCLPAQLLPNYISSGQGGARTWGHKDWRCVTDKSRTQRIQLQCQDGSSRTYKITVVTACQCKRYSRLHNQSESRIHGQEVMSSPRLLHKHQAKSKRKAGKKKGFMDNWHEP